MAEEFLPDFDLAALFGALDQQRSLKGLTWQGLAREINGPAIRGGAARPRAIAASTIKSLADKRVAEGDGVLQMLIWLGRTPESFVPDHPMAEAPEAALPRVGPDQMLRWDTRALHRALQAQRTERRLTWQQVARELRCGPGQLTYLAQGGRVGFPGVMRVVRWLGRPAAQFTRAVDR